MTRFSCFHQTILRGIAFLLICSILLQLPYCSARSSDLKLTQNGYDGVLIAIHKDVPEDARIIEKIREIFISASSTLFPATKDRAFFRHVTILIPSTWQEKQEYEARTKESFSTADVQIAPPNKKYGDTPYVKTYGGCGDAGEFMHLTPAFVTDDAVRGVFGDVGRVIVHEWGHFRWGLQEEYPVPGSGDQKWYFSPTTKKFEAVRCSLSMKGRILQVTGANRYRICKLDNGLPDSEECDFFPGFKIDTPAKVSLMDRQGTKNVEGFCEHNSDEFHLHNREAPSRMNRLCGGKSAWQVMERHEDFTNGANLPSTADMGDEQIKPAFKLVRAVKGASKCRISLVLDVSGSMNDHQKMAKMNKGLQKLIRYTLPEGTEIGTSTFSRSGRIKCTMRKITDEESRRNFVRQCLPTNGNGGTSIGSGLLKGVENLGTTQGGDRIILLTDGEQNKYPGPNEPNVIRALDGANVFVDAISFTAAADKSMVNIAKKYGGNYYFDSNNVNTNSLNEAFGKNPCGDDEDDEDKDIPLMSGAGKVEQGSVVGFVNIDASIGRETKFIFDYESAGRTKDDAGILVRVTSPSGEEFTDGSPEYHVDTDFLNIVISIPDLAEVGRWDYIIIKESTKPSQAYKINILSKSRNGGSGGGSSGPDPLSILATVKSTGVAYPSPMVIFAEASRGGNPVLGLKVVASVDCPPLDPKNPSKPFDLELLDNGIGADAKRDDGIYSRYFATFTQLGRYSFSIKVSNPNGTAKVRVFESAGGWGGAPAFTEEFVRPVVAPKFSDDDIGDDVSRSTTAGASELQVKPGSTEKDINQRLQRQEDDIPPAKIEDLVVEATNFTAGNVTLAWTATGDNYDEGKAGSYQVNWRKDVTEADTAGRTRRSAGDGQIWESVEAGEPMKVTLNVVPGGGVKETFVFNVVATDNAGNSGEPSNAVTAGLGYVPDIVDGKLPFPPASSSNTVVIVIVVVVLLIIVVVVIVIVVWRKKREYKDVDETPERSLRGADNKGMVQIQVNSIDSQQQFKYAAGTEEIRDVSSATSTTNYYQRR